ncbi:DgyrCDS14782 [Dimorphilus gyrociliatus]|uniref:DgyrCDS14782 n=1 Tax=Dimorphilus gyrociliatus TaxID=2664684 RepID=A0A7I8WF83_9ANNE|nr:DgyrCDS14782 [Dimorphilus gyrociliatus]
MNTIEVAQDRSRPELRQKSPRAKVEVAPVSARRKNVMKIPVLCYGCYGLCSICSSITNQTLRICLRRCDEHSKTQDMVEESTVEENDKEPLNNITNKSNEVENFKMSSMDIDHEEEVVTHILVGNIESDELLSKNNEISEINQAPNLNLITETMNEDSFESIAEENYEGDDDFLRKDILENGERIIIFSTSKQLDLLLSSKIWYMNGTFKIVKHPFKQLFSLHSFLKKEGEMKQVPLMFAFMTSKKKKAYNILFKAINELLEFKTPKKIVMDFERAIWKAVLNNWENVTLTGCLFHWNQAVYRKIQELGYSSDFNRKRAEWFEMRQIMALPFLPSHITPIEFGRIKDYLQSINKLGDLIKYFERTWIIDNIWSPKQWSVYQNAIRTNNDVEGFHNRLNGNLRANSSFYSVIDELKREADLIPAYQRMLSEKKILRYQRKHYKNMQSEIFKIWQRFDNHQLTSSEVLEKCSILYSEIK